MTDKIVKAAHASIVIAPAITKDPLATYLLSLQSKESRRTQLSALREIAKLLGTDDPRSVPWPSLTYAHILAIREKLSTGLGPATAQRYFAALRGVMREAWRLRLLETEEWQRIEDIDAPKGSSAETGRALTVTEIRALFESCNLAAYLGWRSAALIAVAIFAGLRRFEIRGLTFEDFDPATGDLRVRGKGKKERVVRLAKLARHYVEGWMKARGDEPGPLIYAKRKGHPIGYSSISKLLARHAEEAGIEAFTPHDLRRTFVTRILEMTGDLAIAQRLAGHSMADTTRKYDKRPAKAAQDVSQRLDEGV